MGGGEIRIYASAREEKELRKSSLDRSGKCLDKDGGGDQKLCKCERRNSGRVRLK